MSCVLLLANVHLVRDDHLGRVGDWSLTAFTTTMIIMITAAVLLLLVRMKDNPVGTASAIVVWMLSFRRRIRTKHRGQEQMYLRERHLIEERPTSAV